MPNAYQNIMLDSLAQWIYSIFFVTGSLVEPRFPANMERARPVSVSLGVSSVRITVLVQAVITKYHGPGGLLTTEIYISQFWSCEGQGHGTGRFIFWWGPAFWFTGG